VLVSSPLPHRQRLSLITLFSVPVLLSFLLFSLLVRGGGIEMAAVSQMKQVNVHVYERHGSGFKRISAFDYPANAESKPIIRVLYGGGVHYGKSSVLSLFMDYVCLTSCFSRFLDALSV
jgi:hypothetical protein